MEALKKQRSTIKGQMSKLLTYAVGIKTKTDSVEEIKARLDKTNQLWTEFARIEGEMFEIDAEIESHSDAFDETYYHAVALLNGSIRKFYPNQFNTSMTNGEASLQSGPMETKLPRLHIPVFQGDYHDWQSFFDLFNTFVHERTSLSAAQKLQYLKGLLRGEPLGLIRHLSITDANYMEAYQLLSKRYDRKKVTINSYIETFFQTPPITRHNSATIRKLANTTEEIVKGLKALGTQGESRDPWLIYIIVSKLDDESRQFWQQEASKIDHPSFQDLIDSLVKRADTVEGIRDIVCKPPAQLISSVRRSHTAKPTYTTTCPLCEIEHILYQCPKFKAMSVTERRSYIQKNSRCFNCLSNTHTVHTCRSKRSCQVCNKRHNSLLHLANTVEPSTSVQSINTANLTSHKAPVTISPSPAISSPNISSTEHNVSVNLPPNAANTLKLSSTQLTSTTQVQHENHPSLQHITNNHEALLQIEPNAQLTQSILPTALVHVKDAFGDLHTCRVLLDSGSQASFVTEACIKRLSLPTRRTNVRITGVGSSTAGIAKRTTSLDIHSRHQPNYQLTVEAFILPKITTPLPSTSFPIKQWHHLNLLKLADPNYNETSTIDLLIGAEHFFDIIIDGKRSGSTGEPIDENSVFGWVIVGQINEFHQHRSSSVTLLSEIDINSSLQKFWETEEVPTTNHLTDEQQLSENHFEQTHTRSTDGKFIVSLPFKPIRGKLGNSLKPAIRRFLSLENKLQKDPNLRKPYISFMREYIALGHMKLIPPDQITIDDANSFQGSLYSILLRFRKHFVVFSADIEKMYRQIGVTPTDADYQRIVWRENPQSRIQHYRLKTVTYGTSPAPYLATKTLVKLADEYQNQYHVASQIIREDFYIDDLMSGANTEQEAHQLRDQILQILTCAGFNLRKWTSNCPQLLSSIPTDSQHLSPVEIQKEKQSVKLLGLQWSPKTDSFHFKVSIDPNPSNTKREMLSEASRIFDPIGWLAPSTVMVKILFQSLWLLNLQWDDPLPANISKRWIALRTKFRHIERISIPRWLQITFEEFQLHGFSDTSETAYSAVIYTRCRDRNGTIVTNIVTAKTKVAPIKPVSIPRLKLCGAILLTRLMKLVVESLQCPRAGIYLWTDCANVLWWLSSHPKSWKTYVANRTSEILETTARSNWRYVPTKENPADCASRGILPSVLTDFELWWKGPPWLVKSEENWHNQKNLQPKPDQSEKRISALNEFTATIRNDLFAELAEKYSQFSKLFRIIARLLQFIGNLRRCKNNEAKSDLLSPTEFKTASELIFKYIQNESFTIEVQLLSTKKPLPKSSKIVSLKPFLDDFGVLRVGSRIKNANIPYAIKFPVILPADHIVTQLIVDETHTKYLHASQSLLITTLRQKYWIIKCKNAVRRCIRKCVPCTRYRAEKSNQLMGDLPTERVYFKYTFYQTGVDYAGPIWLKCLVGRKKILHKGYIAIFVCLSSKAVHIELVSDLTTEAFIASLKRFVSRRGVCADIFSDNGTNFIGAKNTFAEIQNLIKSKKHNNSISNFLLDFDTKWHLIPPSAPSFGGLWEAAVKSTKYHIRRVLGKTILNFEEMTTFLTQVEAILNSRPLCLLSPHEEDALTPAHFITGQSLTMLPDPDYKLVTQNRLSRWQLVQQLMQHFWARWHNEYLTSLHSRSKWQHKHKNLAINDIVLIREDNVAPANWPLGRITELHPGKDGVVRVVTILTKSSTCKRPILKLVLLPVY